MPNVSQDKELELVLVSLDTLVTHTWPVDQSVFSTLTVPPTELVSTTNVLIPVLVSVVSMLSVMPTDISPYVHASWDMKEIQSLNVN